MANIGDFLLGLKGTTSPMARLAALQAGDGGGTPAPGGAATTAPGAAPAPPQPAALQSPPDLLEMYSELSNYQRKSDGIDRGLAMMAASLAHPENRAMIMGSVPQSKDPLDQLGGMMKLRTAQEELTSKAAARANLPALAEKYGLDLNTAMYLFDTGALDNVIQAHESPGKDPAEVESYKFYVQDETKNQRTPKSFDEWRAESNRAREKLGLTPHYTVDKTDPLNPKIRSFQLSDSPGTQPREIKDDQGNPIEVKPVKSETETEVIWTNPYTQEVVQRMDKQNYEAARRAAVGKGVGEADVKAVEEFPKVEASTNKAMARVDELLAMDTSASTDIWGVLNRRIPGTDAYAINKRLQELEGGVFLKAFETLKGGGQITETEGLKAQQAMARMAAAQSDEDFRLALNDYKREMRIMYDLAKNRVSKAQTRSPEVGAPVTVPKMEPREEISNDDLVKKWLK